MCKSENTVAEVLGFTLFKKLRRDGTRNKASDFHSYLFSILNILQDL